MRAFAKLALPPLAPVALIVVGALIGAWIIGRSPVQYLPDGTIDNGPELASGALVLLSPLIYLFLFALHVVVLYLGKRLHLRTLGLWLSVLVLFACLLVASSYRRSTSETFFHRTAFSFIIGALFIAPMGVASRLLKNGVLLPKT